MPVTVSRPPAESLPWPHGPYSVKRHGVTLANCDSEPVRTPGCIQAHGALLVLRRIDLVMLQASANTGAILGHAVSDLLGRPVADLLDPDQLARLHELLASDAVAGNPVHAFRLPARTSAGGLDVSMHTVDGVVVLEFETTRSDGEIRTDNYLALLRTAVHRLEAADSLQVLFQGLTDAVRDLTGTDRVMVYRFHADLHGEVVAESRCDDVPSWLGLHYPEADIPRPAREMFERIWIRPLPDPAGELVELVPLANPDTGAPLDMTHCALRGASIMYTEYLANMGVGASLTMSLRRDGALWGLIACHHRTPYPFLPEVRTACELLAQVASLQLLATERAELLAYRVQLEAANRTLVSRSALDGDLMGLTGQVPMLLDAMKAGGAAVLHLHRWSCVGRTPDAAQLDSLVAWLESRGAVDGADAPPALPFVTDSLAQEYPPGAAFADVASGILAVPLSRGWRDLIVWFRPEVMQTVRWAGSPHDKPLVAGPHGLRLTPRRSFELFVESVRLRSLPWLPVETEAALQLRTQFMELVVSRLERLAALNADLARSNDELDAFAYVASHDLKEPLRGIHKFACKLLEQAPSRDAENRRRLEGLMRLTVRMDTLLDSLLHFSRVGRSALELELVDLNEVVDEALEMIGARRTDCALRLDIPRPLPCWRCDRVRVREVFTNLLSNALKYTRQPIPHVTVGYLDPGDPALGENAPTQAAGQTVFFVKDDGIGIERRHFEHVFRLFKRMHGRDEFGGGVGAGLTIVAQVVGRHGGQVWVESAPPVGTTFLFTLPSDRQAPP